MTPTSQIKIRGIRGSDIGVFHAGGMAACSRWLSAATPPVGEKNRVHPEGMPADLLVIIINSFAGTPAGVQLIRTSFRWRRFAQPPATCCDTSGVLMQKSHFKIRGIRSPEFSVTVDGKVRDLDVVNI